MNPFLLLFLLIILLSTWILFHFRWMCPKMRWKLHLYSGTYWHAASTCGMLAAAVLRILFNLRLKFATYNNKILNGSIDSNEFLWKRSQVWCVEKWWIQCLEIDIHWKIINYNYGTIVSTQLLLSIDIITYNPGITMGIKYESFF